MKTRRYASLAAALLIAGCAHTAASESAQSGASRPAAAVRIVSGTKTGADEAAIGVVHTAQLLSRHRLAAVFAADNRQLLILTHVQDAESRVASQSDIQGTQTRLQAQLHAIAARAQARLQAHAHELEVEERREVASLYQAADRKTQERLGANAMVARANVRLDAIAANQQAQFRHGISAEQQSVLSSVQNGLDTQNRTALQSRASEYSLEESTLATELAKRDAQTRVTLRLKQANLHLSTPERTTLDAQLAALDRDQATTLQKKRSDDARALTQFADDLKHHRATASAAAADTVADIGRQAVGAAYAGQTLATPEAPPVQITPAAADPQLRSRIAAVHAKYQARFTRDEQQSISDFQAQRANFQGQLRALVQADSATVLAARRRFTALVAQRDHVRETMLADIRSAINTVAAREHVRTVIVDPLGASGQTRDLTGDVAAQLTAGGT